MLTSLLGEEGDILREQNFQALVLANVLAPLGIPLVSPILSALTGPFGVSSSKIGLLIAAYTAPPIFLIPVAGVLADRYGRKPLLLGGILLFGTAGSAIALTTDFRVAVTLRFLQGAAYAGMTPIVITSIGDLYTGAREATAQGLRFTSSGVYQAIFPPIAGILVGIAWQYPFLIYALAFPIAVIVYFWFEEPLDATEDEEEGEADEQDRESRLRELGGLLARRRVLSLILGRGLPMVAWVGFLTYNSLLVVGLLGGTAAQAGLLVTINSITLAIGGSQAGRLTSLLDSRLWPLTISNLALGGGLALVAIAPSFLVAAVGTAFLGAGFGVSLSLYRSLVTGLAPSTLRGSLVSVAESFGRVSATATPIGMGALVAVLSPMLGHAEAVRWTAIGVGIIVAVGGQLCLLLARTAPRTPAEQANR